VPDTVALAGFNGLSFLEALPLQLTTTRTPRHEIGLRAGQILMTDAKPGKVDMGAILIPGETS
jgi:LacI family gluconate utilization system Gnt-I transcriptional repressor